MNEFSSAKIKFTIGGTAIAGCYGTPDMGSEPAKIDVTSFDDTEYKNYIEGLMDTQSLNFDFFDQTSNFSAAHVKDGQVCQYQLTFPDNSGYSWSGTHRTFKLAASVGDAVKFRIACTPNGKITATAGTAAPAQS